MEPKTGKKIVSRREYAKLLGLKWSYFSCGLVCTVTGGMVAVIGVTAGTELAAVARCGILVGFVGCLRFGARCFYSSSKVAEAVVPLTRANTTDLPASESLVRASEEPMQAQEAVLLRAVMEGQERHEEQLVRAANGQETR